MKMKAENTTNNTSQFYAQTKQILTAIVSAIRWLYREDNLSLFLWETSTKMAKPIVAAYVAGEVARSYIYKLGNQLQPNTPTFYTDDETTRLSTDY
jgi:hypothetical protein